MVIDSIDEHYAGWEISESKFGGWSADCTYAIRNIWCWNKEDIYFEIDLMNDTMKEEID